MNVGQYFNEGDPGFLLSFSFFFKKNVLLSTIVLVFLFI